MHIRKLALLTQQNKLIILTILVGLFLMLGILYLDHHNKIQRDQQRIGDIQKIQLALDEYYQKHDYYPDAQPDGPCDRWDIGFWQKTGSDGFINQLIDEGFLDQPLGDPIFYSRCDRGYFYHRYYCNNKSPVYPCYGCARPFYILGIRKLESTKIVRTIRAKGPINSNGFQCPNRDWGQEFDYVVGEWEEEP